MSAAALLALVLATPPSLGDALRSIGAFDPPPGPPLPGCEAAAGVRGCAEPDRGGLDHTLDAPPRPPRTGARLLMASGGALLGVGLLGSVLSPGCATRAADGRCVDPRGSAPLYPTLIFAGLATLVTGSYWYRQDLGVERPDP